MQTFYVTLTVAEMAIHYQISAPCFASATMLTQAFIAGIAYGNPLNLE